ncbi:MFS transporter [Pararhodobacter oceanensis]|uniref:MFS transporter n=1 Tax=Pararhodobacter oceanensis TaxID=2172121 RepID=UPI003A903DE4
MVLNLRAVMAPVRSLLTATVAFMAGNSLLGVVLPLRMEAADYPVALTGVIMAAYYLGLAFGGYKAKHIIMRIGHIRAFSSFAALTAATCLGHAFLFDPLAWGGLRIINGFCIAGMTTAIESWLNSRSSNETRGRVLGVYMLTFYLALALGQTMVNIAPVGDDELLMISSLLIGLSLIPVAMTRLGEPDLGKLRVLGIARLFQASKVGVVGAAVAGVLIGSFYAMGVVYARQVGLSVAQTAMFMSTVVLGGLAFQLPVGIVADRMDRRLVMAGLLIAVGASWALLSLAFARDLPLLALMILALVFGGTMSSVYPLCVAQTFDRLNRKYYVAASGRLLMVYSIGATIGPLIASALMALFGPQSFFVFESLVACSYALFVFYGVWAAPAEPKEAREKFVPVPDISPAAVALDPRIEPEELARDAA